MTDQSEKENAKSSKPVLGHPRCLASLPSDIEELLREFEKQGK